MWSSRASRYYTSHFVCPCTCAEVGHTDGHRFLPWSICALTPWHWESLTKGTFGLSTPPMRRAAGLLRSMGGGGCDASTRHWFCLFSVPPGPRVYPMNEPILACRRMTGHLEENPRVPVRRLLADGLPAVRCLCRPRPSNPWASHELTTGAHVSPGILTKPRYVHSSAQ